MKRVVSSIVDGDTFVIEGGRQVRIWGIDAPEASPWKGNPPECCGPRATLQLMELLRPGDVVRINLDDEKPIDGSGRYLGKVKLPDGRDVGLEMLATGLAAPFKGLPYHASYDPCSLGAKQARKGAWEVPGCAPGHNGRKPLPAPEALLA